MRLRHLFKAKTMSTKAERRASYENRVDQDGRLTGKHIKTLLHLQDLHSENDLLKARIAELELQQAKAARCDLLEREVEKLRVSWCVFLRTLNRYLHNHYRRHPHLQTSFKVWIPDTSLAIIGVFRYTNNKSLQVLPFVKHIF